MCLCVSGGESTGGTVKKAVRLQQEGDSTVSPAADGPERGQPALQGVPTNERRLPQLHGDYCRSHSYFYKAGNQICKFVFPSCPLR